MKNAPKNNNNKIAYVSAYIRWPNTKSINVSTRTMDLSTYVWLAAAELPNSDKIISYAENNQKKMWKHEEEKDTTSKT